MDKYSEFANIRDEFEVLCESKKINSDDRRIQMYKNEINKMREEG